MTVAGAEGATFTLDHADPADSGSYDVEITNICGSIISDAAVITVWPRGSGDVDGNAVFQEFGQRLIEHFVEKRADYSCLRFF